MAKKSPVTSCTPKHIPNKEPKFHQIEMLAGLERSIKDPLSQQFKQLQCCNLTPNQRTELRIHIPNKEQKFHQVKMLAGLGRSIKDPFAIF